MSLHSDIKNQIKDAMIKKETVRLTVLRSLIAAFSNELIAKKMSAPELPDNDALAIIRRLVKQHKDSIDQFQKGGRADLVKEETAELVILESYLPSMMARDAIKKIAVAKKTELGITDKTKIGQFVGALMKDLKGKADGADVKAVAEELFA